MSDQGGTGTGTGTSDGEIEQRQTEILGVLRSIDGRLEGLPDWRAVVDEERVERKPQVAKLQRLTRWLLAMGLVLLVVVAVLGGVVWSMRDDQRQREIDRKAQAHESRCDIRRALVPILDAAHASSAESEAILDQFDQDLDTGDCA